MGLKVLTPLRRTSESDVCSIKGWSRIVSLRDIVMSESHTSLKALSFANGVDRN